MEPRKIKSLCSRESETSQSERGGVEEREDSQVDGLQRGQILQRHLLVIGERDVVDLDQRQFGTICDVEETIGTLLVAQIEASYSDPHSLQTLQFEEGEDACSIQRSLAHVDQL